MMRERSGPELCPSCGRNYRNGKAWKMNAIDRSLGAGEQPPDVKRIRVIRTSLWQRPSQWRQFRDPHSCLWLVRFRDIQL